MSFLNVILLGGAAALLAPLIIHLLNRARFQTVDWGAMHLLDAAIEVNSRRVQWESLLLLLIRCLIPVLLAVSLARPVLTQFKVSGAGGDKSLLMLLDDSLSMSALADENGKTLLDKAKTELEAIVERNDSAELSLWTMGGGTADQLGGTTFSGSRVVAGLQHVTGGTGGADISNALLRGVQQLQTMSNPNRQLVLASDFQASYWQSLSEQDLRAVRAQLGSGSFPAELILLPMAPSHASQNLAVELSPDRQRVTRAGDSHRLAVRVVNYGEQAVEGVEVVFQADGQALASRTVSLAADGSEQLDFVCEFSEAGLHSVAVHVEDPFEVHGDDWVFDVLQVSDQKRVLIVDAAASQPEFAGSSRYLQLALAPFQTSGDRQNPFRVELATPSQVNAQRLTDCDVVVVAGVPSLSDDAAQAVTEFVRGGGGLLLFAGQQLDAAWYNAQWCRDGDALLPMRFGKIRERDAATPMRVADEVIQEEELRFLNDRQSGLQSFEFVRWAELLPLPEVSGSEGAVVDGEAIGSPSVGDVKSVDLTSAAAPEVAILLKLSDGDPWLCGREYGDGYVIQCATSCSDDWSNMPLKPAYLPLAQTLVETLAQRRGGRTHIMTGESIEVHVVSADAGRDAPTFPSELTVVGPANRRFTAKVEAGRSTFAKTSWPGLYRVLSENQTPTNPSGDVIEPDMFAVRVSPAESDLRVLSAAELRRVAEQLGATLVETAVEYSQAQELRRDGKEIWRWFLAGLLGLLLVELILGQRITRGSV